MKDDDMVIMPGGGEIKVGGTRFQRHGDVLVAHVPNEQNSCEWCRDGGQVILKVSTILDEGEVYLHIEDGKAGLWYCAPRGDEGWDIDIEYCPNCGRKLNNE